MTRAAVSLSSLPCAGTRILHGDFFSHERHGQPHLKSESLHGEPSYFCKHAWGTHLVPTLRAAILESSSDLAPVHTILPLAKISAVVLGSRMRMMTAAKRCVCVCVCV